MADADAYIADVFECVAALLTATGLPGADLRERRHLDPYTKDEVEARSGDRPPARTLSTPAFPGVGPVDVVLAQPRALIELKWSYQLPGKIFESVWDATKLLLLGQQYSYENLYVVTGAALSEWNASESADLFGLGELDTIRSWSRPLVPPRGPNSGSTVGEDLVIGARGHRPLRAHSRLAVRWAASWAVDDGYELRAARIEAMGPLVDWPTFADRLPTSRSEMTSADAGAFQLPRRVTQRWIENTAGTLKPDEVPAFMTALRVRGWSEQDLRERIWPYVSRSE